MTEVMEQIARGRVASLEQESATLTGEGEGFLLFAHEKCSIVDFLSLLWRVSLYDLKASGVPAKLFLEECDLLLTLARTPERFLSDISKVWQQRALPKKLAEPVHADVQSARDRLESLVRDVRKAQERVAKPSKVSADPEELKQRVQQADEQQQWLPLRDVVARMRQNTPSKQD